MLQLLQCIFIKADNLMTILCSWVVMADMMKVHLRQFLSHWLVRNNFLLVASFYSWLRLSLHNLTVLFTPLPAPPLPPPEGKQASTSLSSLAAFWGDELWQIFHNLAGHQEPNPVLLAYMETYWELEQFEKHSVERVDLVSDPYKKCL